MMKSIALRVALGSSTAMLLATSAWAQASPTTSPNDTIVVVGSQIKGADIGGDLPVTVVTNEDLRAAGLTTGEDLLRAIPQIGAIGFNSENGSIVGVNAARGDVSSYNLRSLGEGNTLVLINGRRMVLHPITQTSGGIPVTSPNANTLPTSALERVEVLRDGAGAIYGADAVAGVINYVLDKDFEGAELTGRIGGELDGGRFDTLIKGAIGLKMNEGRTSLVISGSYDRQDGLFASEKSYAADSDLRKRAPAEFAADTGFDQRSSLEAFALVNYNGLGSFHLRPTNLLRDNGTTYTIANCGGRGLTGAQTAFSDGVESVCLDSKGQDRAIFPNRNEDRTLVSDNQRYNVFANLSHEITDNMEFFGEASYYYSKTQRQWEQASILSDGRFFVPADYYYNPFGPVTFDDGRVNPNRLPGLNPAIVPVEGLGFELTSLRPTDVGPRYVTVTGESYRLVAGLRGQISNWDYDTAFVHSVAKVTDLAENRISTPLFQQSLRLDTPDAYNIFTGVNPNNPASVFDATPNPRSRIDPFIVSATREAETQLTLADFRISNPSLFSLPAGDVGIGLGFEWRSETLKEDNDSIFDGTMPFIDPLDTSLAPGEITNRSSLQGSSFRPDIRGDRQVISAYGELLIPVLRDQPFFHRLDVQAAVRYEHFSSSGGITRPKVAVAWAPIEELKFRGSFSLGFRAPNLVQLNNPVSSITTDVDDFAEGILLGTGTINDSPSNGNFILETSGNPDLQPERSQNWSAGFVVTPVDGLVFTADYWKITTNGTVGVLGSSNQSRLDAVLRSQGSSNPNVIRDTPNPDNPLGEILLIRNAFENLDTRTAEGIDLALNYRMETGLGRFDLKLNAARLITFDQEEGELAAILLDFGADADALGSAAGSLIETSLFPKWRGSASAQWTSADRLWNASVFATYVGKTFQSGITNAEGDSFEIEPHTVVSLSLSRKDVFEEGTSVRLGMRNVFDTDPPLAADGFGYSGELHSNLGRYLYLEVTKRF